MRVPNVRVEHSLVRLYLASDVHFEDIYIDSYLGYETSTSQYIYFVSTRN